MPPPCFSLETNKEGVLTLTNPFENQQKAVNSQQTEVQRGANSKKSLANQQREVQNSKSPLYINNKRYKRMLAPKSPLNTNSGTTSRKSFENERKEAPTNPLKANKNRTQTPITPSNDQHKRGTSSKRFLANQPQRGANASAKRPAPISGHSLQSLYLKMQTPLFSLDNLQIRGSNHCLLVFTGESSFHGFLGGAGFRPSTVALKGYKTRHQPTPNSPLQVNKRGCRQIP